MNHLVHLAVVSLRSRFHRIGVGGGGGGAWSGEIETEREGRSVWLDACLLPGQLDCMHPSRVRRELASQKKLKVLLLEMRKDAD